MHSRLQLYVLDLFLVGKTLWVYHILFETNLNYCGRNSSLIPGYYSSSDFVVTMKTHINCLLG